MEIEAGATQRKNQVCFQSLWWSQDRASLDAEHNRGGNEQGVGGDGGQGPGLGVTPPESHNSSWCDWHRQGSLDRTWYKVGGGLGGTEINHQPHDCGWSESSPHLMQQIRHDHLFIFLSLCRTTSRATAPRPTSPLVGNPRWLFRYVVIFINNSTTERTASKDKKIKTFSSVKTKKSCGQVSWNVGAVPVVLNVNTCRRWVGFVQKPTSSDLLLRNKVEINKLTKLFPF